MEIVVMNTIIVLKTEVMPTGKVENHTELLFNLSKEISLNRDDKEISNVIRHRSNSALKNVLEQCSARVCKFYHTSLLLDAQGISCIRAL